MSQTRHYPLTEQIMPDGTIWLSRLDELGFCELERRDQLEAPHNRDFIQHSFHEAFGHDDYELQIGGTRHDGTAGFSGPLFVGHTRGVLGVHRIIICRPEHRRQAQQHLNSVGLPGMLGIVEHGEIRWIGPDGNDVFANPLAAHLLTIAQQETTAKIGITEELLALVKDVGRYTYFVSSTQHAVLVGCLVIEIDYMYSERQDIDKIRIVGHNEGLRIDYYTVGLDEIELATYAGLRRSNFNIAEAQAAARLINA